METTNHHQTLKRRNRELTILNQIAEALNREVDLPQALHTALESIVQLFDLTTGWIYILNKDANTFYTAATVHLPPALSNHPRRMAGTCYCLDTYLEGDMEGAANINAIHCSRLKDLKEGTEGLSYHASIPLYAQNIELGVLNVASPDWREISAEDLRLLHTVGDLMSIAIQRARLFQKSRNIGVINERNRIAREIHDTIAQGLTAIALQLETADALLEANSDRDQIQEMIASALELTRSNLEEARRSVLDLRAAPLEDRTLPEALHDLLNTSDLQTRLDTHFEIIGSRAPLPTRIAVSLYRIAQEAINNVRQHAAAETLKVQLILIPDEVKLLVKDDGRGFDPELVPAGHYGLIGLRERARLMGGKLHIHTAPDTGTIVKVVIPLEDLHE